MNNPKVSIVIPTYGRAEYIKNLIKSVRMSTPEESYEFVVVSSDLPESEKVKWLSQQSDVNLILADTRKEWQLRKRSPIYYTNIGIKRAKYEWVLLVNDDIRFDANWYKELQNLLADPKNSNVGMIIVLTHLGKVKYGPRIIKIGKTRKKGGDWKDLYLSDFSIISKSVMEQIGYFDEKLKFHGCGADNSLAVEFLTDKDTAVSDKIRLDHLIADEGRDTNITDEFTDFNYLLNKWNNWCRMNGCEYVWDTTVKPYTAYNRIVNWIKSSIRKQLKIMRFYKKYILKTWAPKKLRINKKS